MDGTFQCGHGVAAETAGAGRCGCEAPDKEVPVVRKSEVSAVDLRRSLSAFLDSAWREPLLVTRYGMPWVWILSDATWRQQHQHLRFSQEDHPLVPVRKHVDEVLEQEVALMRRLFRTSPLGTTPEPLFRALVLQAIYSFGSMALLHEQIVHNRLFGWFVGFDSVLLESWKPAQLADGLRNVLDDEGAVDLVGLLLQELPIGDVLRSSGLAMEADAMKHWRSRLPW